MAAGFLGVLLVLGLLPAGGAPDPAADSAGPGLLHDLPAVETADLPVPAPLPVGVEADPASLGVAVDAPLPVALDTDLAVCQGCLGLGLAAGPGASAEPTPAAPASRSGDGGVLSVVEDAPPEAVAAGSSVLAVGLAAAAWLARAGLGSLGGLFSRIEDGDLARHPMRRQALDFIAANPGATVQDVRRALGLAWGTTVYHLGRLEKAGQVAVRHMAGRRGHWPLGQAPRPGAPAGTGEALVRLVRERPGLSQAELARLAGVGAPAACKQLRRLASAGLVTVQRAGRAQTYRATERLDAVLAPAAAAAAC